MLSNSRAEDDAPATGYHHNRTISTIEYYYWDPILPKLSESDRNIFINLTSNSSAGPLVIDTATNRLYFIDMNPYQRFIGYVNITESILPTYHVSFRFNQFSLVPFYSVHSFVCLFNPYLHIIIRFGFI